jgi:hypothetical protein
MDIRYSRNASWRAGWAAVSARTLYRVASAGSLAVALVCAGCATVPSEAPAAPAAAPRAVPPPPPVNLQGFPLAYRQGFGDGCDTARGTERKDATRLSGDGNYRVGWQDGMAQCKAK